VFVSFTNLNLVFTLHNDEFRRDELLKLEFFFLTILEMAPLCLGRVHCPAPVFRKLLGTLFFCISNYCYIAGFGGNQARA
jgi:hypothetical protein